MNEDLNLVSYQMIRSTPKIIIYLLSQYISRKSAKMIKLLQSPDNISWRDVIDYLKELFGNQLFFDIEEHADWERIDLPLLLLFLYQTLPQFKNVLQIEFKGAILETLEKSVQLSNSNLRTTHYMCCLEGSKDFILNGPNFEIPAKSNAILKVSFKSRFVKRSEAFLRLVSSNLNLNRSSIIFMSLFSKINDLKPIKTVNIESEIYASPINSIQINVTNIFDVAGSFTISLRQFKVTNYQN